MAEASLSIMQEEDLNSIMEDLFCACRDGATKDLEVLLATHPDLDLNTTDEAGYTAVHVACYAGHVEVLKLLQKKGANFYALTSTGEAAVHCAARGDMVDVLEYLVLENHRLDEINDLNSSFRHDFDARNENYQTPLHVATSLGFEDSVDFLLQAEVDINLQEVHGNTALHMACELGENSIALRLLGYHCFTDLTNQQDETPLHIACRGNLFEVVQTLCTYGCLVGLLNRDGLTPLHIAAKVGNCNIIRCLLLSKADFERLNKDQVRAEDIALALGNTEAANLLAKMSASVPLDKRDTFIKQLEPFRLISCLKLKMLGSSGVGKTTLIDSMKRGHLLSRILGVFSFPGSKRKSIIPDAEGGEGNREVNRRSSRIQAPPHQFYTNGITVEQVNIADVGDLSIWDFSGYEPYYFLYDHFLGDTNSIHVIVISMKDSEEERVRQIYFWLNFIRARMAPVEPVGHQGGQLVASRVLLVATHADVVQSPRNTRGQFTMQGKAKIVNDLLVQFGADLFIIPHFFVLDATQASSPEMKELRNEISATKINIIQYLPNAIGTLEDTIVIIPDWVKILSDFPVVSWSSFVQYIRSNVNLLATDELINELVRQLQIVGQIVTLRTDENNDDLVVLSPHWLCSDFIGRFFTYERIFQVPSNGRLSVDYIRSVFPRCDISDVTRLLETLEISSRTTFDNLIEYNITSINIVERPKKLWEPEDSEALTLSSPDMILWGGVQICSPSAMGEQCIHLFPRIQTNLRTRLSKQPGNYNIYNWRLGTKIRSEIVSIVIELIPENMSIEVKTRGLIDNRILAFYLQEQICEIIFSVIGTCCPGMYLERRPISVASLRQRRTPSATYMPRTIHLAKIDSRNAVQVLEPNAPLEQLVDVVAFGSPEIFANLRHGMDLHIANMSLYSRFILARQLDWKHGHGRDWCLLGFLLGLDAEVKLIDVNKNPTLSETDQLLALWSKNDNATFGMLYEKLVQLDRSDVVDSLLYLTPLFQLALSDPANTQPSNLPVSSLASHTSHSSLSPSSPPATTGSPLSPSSLRGTTSSLRNQTQQNQEAQALATGKQISDGSINKSSKPINLISQSNQTQAFTPNQPPKEAWQHQPGVESIKLSELKIYDEQPRSTDKSVKSNNVEVRQESHQRNPSKDADNDEAEDDMSSPLEPLPGLDEMIAEQVILSEVDPFPIKSEEVLPNNSDFQKHPAVPLLNLPQSEDEGQQSDISDDINQKKNNSENISEHPEEDTPELMKEIQLIDSSSDESLSKNPNDENVEAEHDLTETDRENLDDDMVTTGSHSLERISGEVSDSTVVVSEVSRDRASADDSDEDSLESLVPDVFSPVTSEFDSQDMSP